MKRGYTIKYVLQRVIMNNLNIQKKCFRVVDNFESNKIIKGKKSTLMITMSNVISSDVPYDTDKYLKYDI